MGHSNRLRRPSIQKLSMVVALTAMLGACQDNDRQASDKGTVEASPDSNLLTSAIGDAADLSISTRLIGAAQLGSALDGEGSYTVFLPVDDAWESLEEAELQAIESADNRPQLISVLRQHIAPGYVLAADLEKGLVAGNGVVTLTTMGAAPITLHRDGQTVTLGQGKDAPRIVGAPMVAGNDVVYRIDRLIPPPE